MSLHLQCKLCDSRVVKLRPEPYRIVVAVRIVQHGVAFFAICEAGRGIVILQRRCSLA